MEAAVLLEPQATATAPLEAPSPQAAPGTPGGILVVTTGRKLCTQRERRGQRRGWASHGVGDSSPSKGRAQPRDNRLTHGRT